jgi:small-conductance mechanosensitive channel
MHTPPQNIAEWFNSVFTTDYLDQWFYVIPTFFISLGLIILVHRSARRLIRGHRDHKPWLDFVEAFLCTNHWPFFLAFAIYVSMWVAPIPYRFKLWFQHAFGVGILLQLGLWANTTLNYFFNQVLSRGADAAKTTVLKAVALVSKLTLWLGVLLLMLDNFGVNISTLIAGLGLGGLAVALGVQKIMGDIFASLSIVMDKPFVLGDFIAVGDYMGTVEDVGIKTTRIRSLTGERIVFSNSDLLQSRIKNYTQMRRRRVAFTIRIAYETAPEKIKLATKIIEAAIGKNGQTTFEFSRFNSFADWSLNIEAVYWVESPAYGIYMDIHEKILLTLIEEFKKSAIDFAYPMQKQILSNQSN